MSILFFLLANAGGGGIGTEGECSRTGFTAAEAVSSAGCEIAAAQ